MTLPMNTDAKCYLCKEKSTQTAIASYTKMGTPDLDLRPPEMVRRTMAWWVQVCPNCGYVSGKISNKTTVRRTFLKSKKYVTCDGIDFASELARRFYKYYLISKVDRDTRTAFNCLHRAAWACDDKNDKSNAILCRKMALTELDVLLRKDKDESLKLIKADLLRRSEQYDKVIEEYSNISFSEELMNDIAKFQIAKAEERDDKCYEISDVKKWRKCNPQPHKEIKHMIENKYREKDEALFTAVQNLKDKSDTNYNLVYELSEKYIYKIINDIVKNHHTTEDLMQEVYLQIYNKIDTLQEAKAFYVWAGRIATNMTLRHIQKYRKEVLAVEDEDGSTDFVYNVAAEDNECFIPENVLMDREKQRLIAEIVDNLSVEQKLAVQYFYYEEMSVRDIAKIMECSEGTVKSRLNYARKAIKDAVIDLDVKQGTRLYNLGSLPLFWLIFREGVETLVLAEAAGAAGVAGASAIGAASTSASGAAKATGIGAKIFGTAAGKTIVGIGAATAVVVGGVAVANQVKEPVYEEPRIEVGLRTHMPFYEEDYSKWINRGVWVQVFSEKNEEIFSEFWFQDEGEAAELFTFMDENNSQEKMLEYFMDEEEQAEFVQKGTASETIEDFPDTLEFTIDGIKYIVDVEEAYYYTFGQRWSGKSEYYTPSYTDKDGEISFMHCSNIVINGTYTCEGDPSQCKYALETEDTEK